MDHDDVSFLTGRINAYPPTDPTRPVQGRVNKASNRNRPVSITDKTSFNRIRPVIIRSDPSDNRRMYIACISLGRQVKVQLVAVVDNTKLLAYFMI